MKTYNRRAHKYLKPPLICCKTVSTNNKFTIRRNIENLSVVQPFIIIPLVHIINVLARRVQSLVYYYVYKIDIMKCFENSQNANVPTKFKLLFHSLSLVLNSAVSHFSRLYEIIPKKFFLLLTPFKFRYKPNFIFLPDNENDKIKMPGIG